MGGVLLAAYGAQDDGELVAAHARHGIAGAHRGGEAPRHFAQQGVAGLVAELVVDRLEAIEVEETDRQQAVAPLCLRQRLFEAVGEQDAIGQAGQAVEIGELFEVLLGVARRR